MKTYYCGDNALTKFFYIGNMGKTYLTQKENKILIALGELFTMSEIADMQNISIKTVQTHVSRIKQKLGVTSRHQLYKIMHNNQIVH